MGSLAKFLQELVITNFHFVLPPPVYTPDHPTKQQTVFIMEPIPKQHNSQMGI